MRYLTEIKSKQRKAGLVLIVAMAAFLTHVPMLSADVCSEGTGIPPFLSSSVDPNMLLIIDNSGSMLDMAYIDTSSQCFDDTFETTNTYAGYFATTTWYKWTENPDAIAEWTTGQCYVNGDIVYGEGAFYKASCETLTCDTNSDAINDGCTANRDYLSQRPSQTLTPNIYWHSPTAPQWLSSLDYVAGDFVTYGKQTYKALANVLASSTPSAPPLETANWQTVDYTWDSNSAYSINDIVSFKGMLYKALKNIAANQGYNDVLDAGDYSDPTWQRLDEGYFEEIDMGSDSCASPSYTLPDLEITMEDNSGNQISGSTIANPVDKITCFRASGNFLNWASSSKFDIQKKILTGGKYRAGYEEKTSNLIDNSLTNDTGDDRLIQESRGCAGKSFVKQISLDAGTNTTDPSDDVTLTLRIRGSADADQIDTTDDRTRIEIFAVSIGGFDDSACQTALTLLQETQPNKTDLQNAVTGCMYGSDTSAWPPQQVETILDRSIMDCWQISKGSDPSASGMMKTHCESIYDGSNSHLPMQYPWLITEWDPFYLCYGEYDASKATKGKGFIGRCWAESPSSSSSSSDCNKVTCTDTSVDPIAALNAASGSKEQYKCVNNEAYKCLKNNCKDSDWAKYYEDSSGTECSSVADPTSRICDDWDGDSAVDALSCWTEWDLITGPPVGGEPGYIAEPVAPPAWSGTGGGTDRCIEYAEWDYCQSLAVPEVIDPSDQVFATGDTYNIPAALIDTGVFTQLNVEKPLLSMSGYLKYTLPLIQDSSDPAGDITDRPDGPRGVVFDIADSLRLGVMAFHNNGSKSEIDLCVPNNSGTFDVCDNTTPSPLYDADYCTVCTGRDDTVTKFNPAGNADGARILVNVSNGMYTDAQDPDDLTDDIEVWDHYLNVITAINDTRATSWTPLAEAMYNALGYYGQDNNRRLQPDDFQTTGDYSAWADSTVYNAGDIVSYNSEYYQTAAGGTSSGTSTNPLDDTGVIWSRVEIDPVQYWCQDNHILIITEGASTADINDAVRTLAESSVADPDANEAICTNGLEGSTYLDDLTYFGQNAIVEGTADNSSNLYSKLIETGKADPAYAKQPVTTHIVTTGSLRTDGAGECSPYTLMTNAAVNGGTSLYSGENPSQLEANLIQALNDILNRASAGSAASVISSSKSGEGAAYQAVFWPKTPRIARGIGDLQPPLSWIGDVHSMFVDSQGRLWDDYSGNTASIPENAKGRKWTEDTNGNGRLDPGENVDGGDNSCLDGDRRMFFYYDSVNTPKGTKICFNDSVLQTPASPVCDSSLTDYCGATSFTEPVEIREFEEYLWSANKELQAIDDVNITINRGVDSTTGKWDFTTDRRYIFTWNDLNNNGVVDSDPSGLAKDDEIIPLETTSAWDNTYKDASHHSILHDFRVGTTDEMNNLIDWLRGDDSYWETDDNTNNILELTEDINGNGIRDYVYRCRRFPDCNIVTDANNPSGRTIPDLGDNPVWRLGDIIHSTPKLVAQPSEGFQTIYRDRTYSAFIKKYRFRRHVVYFGANDGMLHAVNAGFFDENSHQFYRNQERNTTTGELSRNNASGPALGHELWAYIPYNLQPHLRNLADSDYVHRYYVDHEPRIFDVQIWEEESACATNIFNHDCIHPQGWGTILVGSMRFGGNPIDVSTASSSGCADAYWDTTTDTNGKDTDNREFVSSYFILDISDPEIPPTLLGEMTVTSDTTDLGYTTPMPSMVVMRDVDGADSDSNPDTTWYLVMGKGPTTIKGENDEQGKLAILPLSRLIGSNKSAFRFIDAPPTASYTGVFGDSGDTIAIPGGTDLTIPSAIPSFTGDLITVDLGIEQSATVDGVLYKSDAVFFGTVDGTTFAKPDPISYPDYTIWPGNGNLWRLVTNEDDTVTTTPDLWELKKMITSLGPITAAPTIGWDGDNIWIYVGTGRFFANEDKTDDRNQYYYGIKEPRAADCSFSWATVDWLTGNTDPFKVNPAGLSGSHGLLRTDNVEVIFRDFYGYSDSGDGVFFCDPSPTHGKFEPGGNVNTCDMTGLTAVDMSSETITFTASNAYYRYDDLIEYIAGETRTSLTTCSDSDTTIGIDGWYRIFHDDRERNIGQATLLGGLLTFTTYQPSSNLCTPEGQSYLYGLHYQTGSAWYQNIFGLDTTSHNETTVNERFDLGRGLATTPSLHVGDGSEHDAKAFVQTSTGEIVEIAQEDLPLKPPKSGKQGWTDTCE